MIWNAGEENEKTKYRCLAGELVAILPIEIGKSEWRTLLSELIKIQFVDEECAPMWRSTYRRPQSTCQHHADDADTGWEWNMEVQDLERAPLHQGRWGYGTVIGPGAVFGAGYPWLWKVPDLGGRTSLILRETAINSWCCGAKPELIQLISTWKVSERKHESTTAVNLTARSRMITHSSGNYGNRLRILPRRCWIPSRSVPKPRNLYGRLWLWIGIRTFTSGLSIGRSQLSCVKWDRIWTNLTC